MSGLKNGRPLTNRMVFMANETHDGLKRCIRTREIGIRMIRVAHVTDSTAVPLACPVRWSTEGHHGQSRTAPQALRPGLTHVGHVVEET